MATNASDSDLDLIRAMAQGDSRALDKLYNYHGPKLLAYLTSRLGDRQWAEELLQDVMLAAWHGAAKFRGESRVSTWLMSIARRRAINAVQRTKARSVLPIDQHVLTAAENAEGIVEKQEVGELVRTGLRELPDEQRETLELVFFHGFSNRETAVLLGIPPGTVKSRLSRAKGKLRVWFQEREA